MSDEKQIKELIDSFIEYRNVLVPLQESLRALTATYDAVKTDLDSLTKTLSGNTAGQLDKVHSTLAAQAKSGQELIKKIDDYSASGEKYAQAVDVLTKKFAEAAESLEAFNKIEQSAEETLSRLNALISEKRASYNLKELQKSLDSYNKNVEKIADFINKDIADVLTANAEKIEAIRQENERLSAIVSGQSQSIATLASTYAETSALLKKSVEGGSVNQQYLFDAFDRWAQDRKVKIKK